MAVPQLRSVCPRSRVPENYLGRRTCGKDSLPVRMRARKAQASSSQSSPAISAVDRGHWSLAPASFEAREQARAAAPMPSGSMLTGGTSSVSAKLRVPQTLRPPSESESPFAVISSQLETTATATATATASASHRAPPPSLLPPNRNCNCIVLLHYSLCRQHALLYLSHCAASRRQQQIHRQGRCSRRLRLVERAPGPSSESIARASVVAGPS